MSILEKVRIEFIRFCSERGVDPKGAVSVYPLSSHDAIGDAEGDFVIKTGKEHVIEATFDKARGQAFTDAPSKWDGSLEELFSTELSDSKDRGIFVATVNAVLGALGLATGTIHCRNEDPTNCGPELVGQLATRFGSKRFGLVGLQPAILKSLVDFFGPESVSVVDLNLDNIGRSEHGVEVWDGQSDLSRLVEWSEVGLATGSSIVNGTIDEIIRCFSADDKPLVFFGNTISGAAALLDMDRLCPFGR